MEKAVNRQRVLLQHLQPAPFSSYPPQDHESTALSVSSFPFMKTVRLCPQVYSNHSGLR